VAAGVRTGSAVARRGASSEEHAATSTPPRKATAQATAQRRLALDDAFEDGAGFIGVARGHVK
jgi:hypothetical protein